MNVSNIKLRMGNTKYANESQSLTLFPLGRDKFHPYSYHVTTPGGTELGEHLVALLTLFLTDLVT